MSFALVRFSVLGRRSSVLGSSGLSPPSGSLSCQGIVSDSGPLSSGTVVSVLISSPEDLVPSTDYLVKTGIVRSSNYTRLVLITSNPSVSFLRFTR